MWAQAYAERRDMHLTFKHNQIPRHWGVRTRARPPCASTTPSTSAFWWGHPVFSNAAALFGRRISPEELYTCIVDMPRDGVLFIDEASRRRRVWYGGRSGHSCTLKQPPE